MIASPLRAGIMLALLSILTFLVIYFFFRDKNYFFMSVISNAFIMPALYAIFAVMVTYLKSIKNQEISLLQSFGWPFLTLCIAGTLSLIMIFLFFNFIDPQEEMIIKNSILSDWFDSNKREMIDIYGLEAYQNRIKTIQINNLFNILSFLCSLIFCFFYYFILSVLIGLFFRKQVKSRFIKTTLR